MNILTAQGISNGTLMPMDWKLSVLLIAGKEEESKDTECTRLGSSKESNDQGRYYRNTCQ